jgi:hypothetical protein
MDPGRATVHPRASVRRYLLCIETRGFFFAKAQYSARRVAQMRRSGRACQE